MNQRKTYISTLGICALAGILVGLTYWVQSSDSQTLSAQNNSSSSGNSTAAQNSSTASGLKHPKNVATEINRSGSLASPFSLGNSGSDGNQAQASMLPASTTDVGAQAPEKEEISPQEAARRKKMEQLGYMVPPEYYNKDLKTLQKMAKAGDAFAMVHIGEKYAFELNGQANNPEFDSKIDYASAAKQSFKDALVAGNIRSAGIIAELYFQEKNSMQAYAWHLVSDQMGDSISADWFRSTDMAKNATPEIKNAAAVRAAQIMAELKAMQKKTP